MSAISNGFKFLEKLSKSLCRNDFAEPFYFATFHFVSLISTQRIHTEIHSYIASKCRISFSVALAFLLALKCV